MIVHEHLEYYSLAVLERLFAEAGLEVVDGELNDINGGSIRLFIAHAGRREASPEAAERLQELRVREFEMALDSPAPYEQFARNVERVGRELQGALRVDRGRWQDDPRLRRLDQGQHDPPVRRTSTAA